MTVEERRRSTPSRPKPNSVVWISWLYFLLTVVMKSENTSAPFRKFTLPKNSILEMVNRSQGSVSSGRVSGGKSPWYPMLWMVKTVATSRKRGVFGVLRAQQDGNQRGLPVVAVENLRDAENLRGFQHGAGEQGEALGVVGIVARRGAVERIAVEEGRIIDKVELDSGVFAAARPPSRSGSGRRREW